MAEPAPEAAAGRFERAETWLSERRRFVLVVLLGGSILIRLVYWLEMRETPCVRAHEWTQTDMHFFHEWAGAIAGGDWLSNGEYHPLMEWQKSCASQWFAENPDQRALYPGTDSESARALWNRWFHGKQFHQEPLYVYLVAFTYRVFGPEVLWVFLWQMLLGIASNLLIWHLARRYFGELAGAVAALFALFYAPLLFFELALVRTTLSVFIGLGLTALADRAMERGTRREWFVAGLAFGVALLCQTTFGTFILGSAVLLGIRHRKERKRMLQLGGVMSAGILLGLSPFIVRNIAVGAPTLGWASVGPGTFLSDNEASFDPDSGPQGLSASQVRIMGRTNGSMSAIVAETLASHKPGGWIWLLMRKFAKLWHWYEEPDNQNFYYYRGYSSVLAHAPFTFFLLAPLALVGLGLAMRDPRRCALLALMIVAGVAVGVLALPLSRYRVPYAAAMIPFAALAVSRGVAWGLAHRWKPLAGSAIAALALLGWTSRPLPATHPLIRVSDYVAPYGYFWVPRIVAAKDPQEALAIMESSLRHEPPEMAELARLPAQVSIAQAELAKAYVNIYESYANILAACGRAQDAEKARRFSEMLGSIAALIPSGRP